jgi:hypothetical protein
MAFGEDGADRYSEREAIKRIGEMYDAEQSTYLLSDENKNYASFLRKYCNLDQEQIESVAGIADCCDK